ncbi:TetR/AcrR family transcriptional regulator [Streptomyces thermodiastaticus]|jgi:AcrR family transcriptional regulator|uniref:TetR/AcrR family transcriptional regulator n=1 Tax=Streptomyces thermodiastaticus TaxID=44061 RepID=UPI00167C42E5|nr:TetR family transcriptional regulator [Streptomyces thermodiastaticus]MCE7548921.1 TetR family transcriptional regulator [Streptomyces thermodiastaticus]GHF75358.1 TetR family transcriptional regulator [Streptomyces thermodiastaticus]
MTSPAFQRARSAEAKQAREAAILDAARTLGRSRGVRDVTLTDIAAAVGMHKSALLRYFETREQIFLKLTAEGWREWSAALRAELEACTHATAQEVAALIASSLATRPLFCDLLAQAPMNLERNVSVDAVRSFKLVTLDEIALIDAQLRRLLGLSETQTVDLISTATSLAGALWQMATPGPRLRELYRSDPRLGHAVVEVEPRLCRVLTAFLTGLGAGSSATSEADPAAPEHTTAGTADNGQAAGRPA